MRIDYVLVSRGLLPHCGRCEILDTPPKWSDHSALLIEFHGLSPPKKHPPAPLWSNCLQRFTNPSQPSVASFFGRKKAMQGAKRRAAEGKQQEVAKAGKVEEGSSAVWEDSRAGRVADAELASSAGPEAGEFGPDVLMRAGEMGETAVLQVDLTSRADHDESPAEAIESVPKSLEACGCIPELPGSGEDSHAPASSRQAHDAGQNVSTCLQEQAAESPTREEDGGGRPSKRAKAMEDHAITVTERAAEPNAATPLEMQEGDERGAALEASHRIVRAESGESAEKASSARDLPARLQSRGSGRGSGKQSRTEQSPKVLKKDKRQLGIRAFFTT